jgi:hypothetical protein
VLKAMNSIGHIFRIAAAAFSTDLIRSTIVCANERSSMY